MVPKIVYMPFWSKGGLPLSAASKGVKCPYQLEMESVYRFCFLQYGAFLKSRRSVGNGCLHVSLSIFKIISFSCCLSHV